MSLPKNAWTRVSTVREHELDATGRLSLVSLCGMLQEAASRHANELGFSVDHLSSAGLTWVLARLRVDVVHRPGKDAPVRIATWPSGVSGLFATRDFLVSGEDDEPVARATTAWLTLDTRRRRPVRLPDEVLSLAREETARSCVDDFHRLAPLEHPADERRILSGWSDLDVNRHVNHVRYVAWMLDAVPEAIRSEREPRRLDLHFRSEVVADQALAIRTTTRESAGMTVVRQDLVDPAAAGIVAEAQGEWLRT